MAQPMALPQDHLSRSLRIPPYNSHHGNPVIRARRHAVRVDSSTAHPCTPAVTEETGRNLRDIEELGPSNVEILLGGEEKAHLQMEELGETATPPTISSSSHRTTNETGANSLVSGEDNDARTEAWLQRGSSCSVPNKPPKKKIPPNLSLSEKTTKKLEYNQQFSPLSPLNNGRDAYGNYIPTNTQDYYTARSLPTTPTMPPIKELQEQSIAPSLRAGGSWFNNIGFGRAVKDKTSPIRSIEEFLSVENGRRNRSRESSPISPGTRPLTNVNSNSGRVDLPVRGKPRGRPFKSSAVPADAKKETDDHPTELRPPESLKSSYEGVGLPIARASGTSIPSYNRQATAAKILTEKPTTSEIDEAASPPPIPLKNPRRSLRAAGGPTVSIDERDAYEQYLIARGHPQRESQEVGSDFVHGYNLESLQLGESVSVAGQARRDEDEDEKSRRHQQKASRRAASDPNTEEIEAWQDHAQAKFEARMQEIIATYNANKSSIERALRLNQITQDHHDRQAAQYNNIMEKSLKSAVEDTGYSILDDPKAIKEAMHTCDGYAIYPKHDIWHELDSHRHKRLYCAHASYKSRKSSWDQGVHVAGKIARFLLAAPSDPDLKTSSKSRPGGSSESSNKGKGKGRAAEPASDGNDDDVLDPSGLANSTTVGQSWAGTTLEDEVVPSSSRARRRSLDARVSMWPEGDSEGNWRDARDAALRGGDGKEKEKNKRKMKKVHKQMNTWFHSGVSSSEYIPYGGRVIIR